MTEYLQCHKNVNQLWCFNCMVCFESYMVLMRVRNKKTTTKNNVRAIEQIFMLHLVK